MPQKAEIDAEPEILQRLVDEAGVPGLVAAHIAEDIADVGVGDALLDLGIEQATGELGGHRADEEVEEFPS